MYLTASDFKSDVGGAKTIFLKALGKTVDRLKPEYMNIATVEPSSHRRVLSLNTAAAAKTPAPQKNRAALALQGAYMWANAASKLILPHSVAINNNRASTVLLPVSAAHNSGSRILLQSTPTNTDVTLTFSVIAEYVLQKNLQSAAADQVYNNIQTKLKSDFANNLKTAHADAGYSYSNNKPGPFDDSPTVIVTPVATSPGKYYTAVVLHSAKPTGQPTSAPTHIVCDAGYYHDAHAPRCYPCAPGEYSPYDSFTCFNCTAGQQSHGAAPVCLDCGIGVYAPYPRSSTCYNCTWPLTTLWRKSTYCDGVCFCFDYNKSYLVVGFLVFFYFVCLASPGFLPEHGAGGRYMSFNKWFIQTSTFFAFTIFPASDVLSDFLYLLTTQFFSWSIMACCMFFLVIPNSLMMIHLYEMGGESLPFWERAHLPAGLIFIKPISLVTNGTFLWLGWRWNQKFGVPFPMYFAQGDGQWRARRGETVSWFNEDAQMRYEESGGSFSSNVELIVAWIISLIAQLPGAIPAMILGLPCVLNILWIGPWLGLGFYLHQTKALSIAVVWTLWIKTWTGVDTWDADPEAHPIDTKMMNESLYAEFILETLPQLFIQAINNQYTGQW